MTPPFFRTRVTELFGIAHPILLGGLHHLGESRIVAAVVNAGAMGYITARSFESSREFRDDLRRCRNLTGGKPFGVNFSISRRVDQNQEIERRLEIALEEGVRLFETAGTSPEQLVAPIHQAGGLLMHKCTSVRHALTAERLGVDVIALVGHEEGGHPGANQLSAFVNGAVALEQITKPLVIGGGIGSGRQIAAALAMGADAVLMGSRFMVADEIWAHPALKRRIVDADEHCSTTILASLGDTWRVLNNRTAREIRVMETSGASSHSAFGDLILSQRTRDFVYENGDVEEGIVSIGPAARFADRMEPAATIIDRLVADASAAARALGERLAPTNPGMASIPRCSSC